jgi:hypothetical protein
MNFCPEGYFGIEDGDWYEVVSMAYVHNADEFTAVGKDASIKAMIFADDINFGTSSAFITTDKIVYGNGYNLIAGGVNTTTYGLRIEGDINVVLNDLKMVDCGGVNIQKGAKVVVNDAFIKVKYTNGKSRHLFYIAYEGSELTINSGEFEITGTSQKYLVADGNATVGFGKINVYGGKFHGVLASGAAPVKDDGNNVKIYGGEYYVYPSRAFDPTPYLADGYTTVDIAASWVKVVAE